MFAVIISGAFRNLAETWPQNQKMLEGINQPYQVYVHTWDRNFGTPRKVYKDQKGLFPNLFPQTYKEEDFSVDENKVLEIIPNAVIIVETFNTESIVDEYRIPGIDRTGIFQNLLNSAAMYKGISRGFKAALYDSKHYSFDYFIRLRTDFLLSRPLSIDDLGSALYFAGPGVDPGFGYVSDQFFIADKYVAEIVSCTEEKFLNHILTHGWGLDTSQPFYGERVLSFSLKDLKREESVRSEPILGAIKRPEIVRDTNESSFDYLREVILYTFNHILKSALQLIIRLKKW
jgi:hypothetical protein